MPVENVACGLADVFEFVEGLGVSGRIGGPVALIGIAGPYDITQESRPVAGPSSARTVPTRRRGTRDTPWRTPTSSGRHLGDIGGRR